MADGSIYAPGGYSVTTRGMETSGNYWGLLFMFFLSGTTRARMVNLRQRVLKQRNKFGLYYRQ
nr:hypothetical protein [uncultured Draconibacterium sp.]